MNKLLTVKDVADLLQCHPQTIYRNEELACIKIPGVGIRYKKSDLDKYIEQNSIKTHSLMTPLNPDKSFKLTNLDEFDKIFLRGGNSESMSKKTRWNYGFGSVYIRKTKEGKERWYVDYQVDGVRIREVVKNAQSRAEATLHLQEKVSKAFNQVHNSNISKQLTFEELAERYLLNYAKLMKRSFKSDEYIIKANLNPFFGTMKVNQISCLLLEKYRIVRQKAGVKKSTINRELAIMSKIFNVGIDWGFVTENPVRKIKFFSEKDNIKERILTVEEEARLFKACSEHLTPILKVALNTGMRRSEILNLKWSQVDLARQFIKVENTKGGKIRFVNINSALSMILDELKMKNNDGEYLFPNPETNKPYTKVEKAFKTACRKSNIKGLRFHDLRHTFATRLVESGVDLITVKELLGHSTVKITERYTHPNQRLKKEAVEALVQKSAKKSGKLAHIWHMRKKEKSGKDVIASFSIN